jgi:hypothetical protein
MFRPLLVFLLVAAFEALPVGAILNFQGPIAHDHVKFIVLVFIGPPVHELCFRLWLRSNILCWTAEDGPSRWFRQRGWRYTEIAAETSKE